MDNLLIGRISQVIEKHDLNSFKWIVSINKTTPHLIQNGPQCGIVALCMALNSMNVKCSVDELMKYAIENNFTKNGEIFDADYLLKIARNYYKNCKLIFFNDEIDELIEHLLENHLILIAYDSDKNFEPCSKNGTKAHWALINGYMLALNETHEFVNKQNENEKQSLFIELNDLSGRELNKDDLDYKFIYTFNLHGKSQYYGLWNLNKLICSNLQLKDVEDRCKNNEFVIPVDSNLTKTLAARALVIFKNYVFWFFVKRINDLVSK